MAFLYDVLQDGGLQGLWSCKDMTASHQQPIPASQWWMLRACPNSIFCFCDKKYPDKKQLRGNRFVLAHGSRLYPIIWGKSQWQHIQSQEQRESNAYMLITQLIFSTLLHSREWCLGIRAFPHGLALVIKITPPHTHTHRYAHLPTLSRQSLTESFPKWF